MDYRISTITAIAKLNSLINLPKLYNIIDEDENKNIFYKTDKNNYLENIIFIEYGKTKDISNSKGINPKNNKKKTYKKKAKNSKRFDNQLTLIVNLDTNNINMKLFKNGRIQMTGLKNINNGPFAIKIVIDIIKKLNMINNDIIDNIDDTDNVIQNSDLIFSNYKICLINSDFKFYSKLKRNKLFEYLNNETSLICSYEPCIYPGVKIQFFYNNNYDGVCRCPDGFCSNKNKNSKCTKVTIAVFESGCTIITGAKSLEQIDETYKFIKTLLTNNINYFKKIDLDQLLL
jgi:TATA-box binding protein (TBP) (component of TFIID and TFIIIB)